MPTPFYSVSNGELSQAFHINQYADPINDIEQAIEDGTIGGGGGSGIYIKQIFTYGQNIDRAKIIAYSEDTECCLIGNQVPGSNYPILYSIHRRNDRWVRTTQSGIGSTILGDTSWSHVGTTSEARYRHICNIPGNSTNLGNPNGVFVATHTWDNIIEVFDALTLARTTYTIGTSTENDIVFSYYDKIEDCLWLITGNATRLLKIDIATWTIVNTVTGFTGLWGLVRDNSDRLWLAEAPTVTLNLAYVDLNTMTRVSTSAAVYNSSNIQYVEELGIIIANNSNPGRPSEAFYFNITDVNGVTPVQIISAELKEQVNSSQAIWLKDKKMIGILGYSLWFEYDPFWRETLTSIQTNTVFPYVLSHGNLINAHYPEGVIYAETYGEIVACSYYGSHISVLQV